MRRYLVERRPAVIAVELPSSLEALYRKALDRLPQLSVILIPEDDLAGDEARATYIPIEPGDPFVEAMRTALELGSEIVF